MKRYILIIVTWVFGLSQFCLAQSLKQFSASAIITPYRLNISDTKTTVLMFPAAIKSVDRGSRNILVERVAESENALKLKASNPDQTESNLSVITADGRLYSFDIAYNPAMAYSAIDLRQEGVAERSAVQFQGPQLNIPVIKETASLVLHKKRFMHLHVRNQDMCLRLLGLFEVNGILYFKLSLDNGSNLPYTVDFCRFYSTDNKKVKRTAVQEKDERPVYNSLDTSKAIIGKGSLSFVYAIPQFTISDSKHLVVEVYERNGDRKLLLSIKGRELLKARPLKVIGN